MDVVGAGGRSLSAEWADVPSAYLGMSVPGFPNSSFSTARNTNWRHRVGHLHG